MSRDYFARGTKGNSLNECRLKNTVRPDQHPRKKNRLGETENGLVSKWTPTEKAMVEEVRKSHLRRKGPGEGEPELRRTEILVEARRLDSSVKGSVATLNPLLMGVFPSSNLIVCT